jgi:predicted dehydrogenase
VNPWPGPHGWVIHRFVRHVRAGTLPETHVADNIKSLAMVFAAVKSAASGQAEPVEG